MSHDEVVREKREQSIVEGEWGNTSGGRRTKKNVSVSVKILWDLEIHDMHKSLLWVQGYQWYKGM
jgi:hypothetical protein